VRKLAAGLEVEPRLLLGDVEYSGAEPEDGSSEGPEGDKKIGF
jgi:hypothetical protein